MRSLTTHSPLSRWSRRRIGEQEKGSPGPTNMWGRRVCVCRSASAALRSPSLSGTALHPTYVPRETLVGEGMILRPPREAIAVPTPDPGRWRGEPFPIPHNPDPRDGGERASGRHVLRHGHQDDLRAGCFCAGCCGDLGAPWRINSPEQVRRLG